MVPEPTSAPRALIDVGGDCPGKSEATVAVRREPAPKKAGCVPRSVLDSLSLTPESFVDRHLFSLRVDEIEQIALVSGGERLELVRSGVAGHMRAPSDAEVEAEVGQSFARTLHELSAEEVVLHAKAEDFGFSAAPRATATLTKIDAADESAGTETIELGSETSDGFAYVRRLGDGAVLKVARDVARALVPSSFALRSRKVIDEAPARILRLFIASAAVHEVLRQSGSGEWTFEEPKGLAVDTRLADDVAEALANLRADRWVADDDDGSFGIAGSRGSYQLELEGGLIRIETGRATSGGVFARRTDRPGIFVLPLVTQRTLETWAIDRSYFMVEPASVREIRLERRGERQVLAPARGASPEAGLVTEQFETTRGVLAEARAEGVVHRGAPGREEGFDKPLLIVSVVRAEPAPTLRFVIGRGDVW